VVAESSDSATYPLSLKTQRAQSYYGERDSLIRRDPQRVEIATVACGGLAMTRSDVY